MNNIQRLRILLNTQKRVRKGYKPLKRQTLKGILSGGYIRQKPISGQYRMSDGSIVII